MRPLVFSGGLRGARGRERRSRRHAVRPRVAAFIGDRAGNVYAVDAATGAQMWKTKVDDHGVPARGGSLNVAGPAVSGGMLFADSGYVQNGIPGNVLLAFSVDGK